MRSVLILTLSLSCASFCWAQASASAKTTAGLPQTAASTSPGAIEKRTEHIRVEDGGSQIDELRIGGETKTIDVQPKGGMPAYQVAPATGERTWKVVGF